MEARCMHCGCPRGNFLKHIGESVVKRNKDSEYCDECLDQFDREWEQEQMEREEYARTMHPDQFKE